MRQRILDWRYIYPAIVAVTLSFWTLAHASEAVTDRQLVCQAIGQSAAASGLPRGFLARLLWIESRYHKGVISPAGAVGIAQFMPQTAAARGLADPRDPLTAIGEAARLLAELKARFGNLGLAAAAYNAGSDRVASWLRGGAALPQETQAYVLDITGRRVVDWVGLPGSASSAYDSALSDFDCLNAGTGTAARNANRPREQRWQVRLATELAKALDLFNATNGKEDRPDQRVGPAQSYPATRRAANALCEAVRVSGATCEVFEP